MIRYGEFVRDFGYRLGLTVADLNAPLISVLVAAEAQDHSVARQIAGDGTHPGVAGHLILGEALLKAWHAPELVSAVEIDEGARKVHAENATVTDLRIGTKTSWMELENALPLPLDLRDPAVVLALRSSDLVQALNQEMLKVTGLREEFYVLSIDGESLTVLSREQLQKGVNIAILDTPMEKQARSVHSLVIKRNEVQFGRWRQVQTALQNDSLPHKQPTLDALDALEHDLLELERTAATPTRHRFELQPQ